MTDITQEFQTFINGFKKPTVAEKKEERTDEKPDIFLKEAYRILDHFKDLEMDLNKMKPTYLSVSQKKNFNENHSVMSDKEKDLFEASVKTILNQCLEAIEKLQQLSKELSDLDAQEICKRGGAAYSLVGKLVTSLWNRNVDPTDLELQTAWRTEIRSSIIWYLNTRLVNVSSFQKSLQSARLARDLERQTTFSWTPQDLEEKRTVNESSPGSWTKSGLQLPWSSQPTKEQINRQDLQQEDEDQLPPELEPGQLKLLQQQNDQLLEQFQASLQQVHQAEKSLTEISQMQNTLVSHIAIQAKETELLYNQAQNSVEQLGQGNMYLAQATTNAQESRKFLLAFFLIASASLLFMDWFI